MDNDEQYKKKPRNVGPNRVAEKPKDLKKALKKMTHYLKIEYALLSNNII